MPAGISKAKGRRNSKSKRRPGFQTQPAKAGRRKVYGEGSTRKVKSWQPARYPFIIGDSNKYGSPVAQGYTLNPQWKTGEPVWVRNNE